MRRSYASALPGLLMLGDDTIRARLVEILVWKFRQHYRHERPPPFDTVRDASYARTATLLDSGVHNAKRQLFFPPGGREVHSET